MKIIIEGNLEKIKKCNKIDVYICNLNVTLIHGIIIIYYLILFLL